MPTGASVGVGPRARGAADGRRPAALPTVTSSPLRRISLRFVDEDLERRYQRVGGAEGLTGFRINSATAAIVWLIAAAVVPAGTPIPVALAVPVCTAMAAANGIAYLLGRRAETLDRQHTIASILTALNGLTIIALAAGGGVLPGYGISAIMLLLAFGFVSRTGFVFAAGRSAVVAAGFAVAILLYDGPGSLLVDSFIFGAAIIGNLVALRMLERSRRRVYSQEVVINDQAAALREEKAKSDKLLLNVIPAPISARLLDGERTISDMYPSVSVLFADIVGFTALGSRLRPDELIELLDRLFSGFDELVAERGLEKIKTMGDSYMVAGGLPEPLEDHAARVVDLGLAMLELAKRQRPDVGPLPLRIGVHSGPVVGGVIGHRKFAFDIWGDTVNIASRLESHGLTDRVHVSEATWRLVKDRFVATPLGLVSLRGYGTMETYAIASGAKRPGRAGTLDQARPLTRENVQLSA